MLSELQPICLVIATMFSAVFVVAGVSKYREVNRARNWVTTTGTVTESKVRSVRDRSSDTQAYESMPLVVYEYYVAGTKYRSTQINFAEKITGEDIAPTLNKYPDGKIVQVYYNPANPKEAVLEHGIPSGLFIAVIGIIFAILVCGLAAPFAFDFLSRRVATMVPNADYAAPATITFALGLFALMMALAIQNQVWLARHWLVTNGKILDTSVQARESWDSDGRYSSLYNSEIVYSFFAGGGRQYISDRVALGGTMRASINRGVPRFVKKTLEQYPVGASVQVYYNPKNPSACALERRANGMWLPLLVALGFMAAAFKFAGLV